MRGAAIALFEGCLDFRRLVMAVSRPPQSGDESEFTVYGVAVAHQQAPRLAGKCGLGPSPPPKGDGPRPVGSRQDRRDVTIGAATRGVTRSALLVYVRP
jgi:hypothetical protein